MGGHGYRAGDERTEESLKKSPLGPQHQRYSVAFRNPNLPQPTSQRHRCHQEIAVGDGRFRAVVVAQVDVNPVRPTLCVPA